MMNNELKLINFENDIQSVEVEWLWKPYIPYGKITIIQGDPGCGKTMLAAYIISRLSKGLDFETDEIVRKPIKAIYLTGEDGLADTIKPRFEKFNASCELIFSIDDYNQALSMKDNRLEQALIETGSNVLIMDPLQAYLGSNVDMHRANEVRPVLKHVAGLAEKYNCAIILIGHMNKSSNKAQYRSIGSIDLTACARSVLTMGVVGENQEVRALVQIKNSLESFGSPIGFKFSDKNFFEYIGEYEITIEELLQGVSGDNKLEQAKNIITSAMVHGSVESNHIIDLGKKNGISERTMKTAKTKLKIKSIKAGTTWFWQL